VGDAHGDVHRADPTVAEVQAILDERGPGGITASAPIWLASFRINERKVAEYRAGRAFLAGDAAHVHSPAGGQGMNTSMQDACNLAWKLALVCRGLAVPEPLLASYSSERSAVGRQVLTDAGRLTSIAILRSGVLQGGAQSRRVAFIRSVSGPQDDGEQVGRTISVALSQGRLATRPSCGRRRDGAGGGIRTHGSGGLARRVACYSTPAPTSYGKRDQSSRLLGRRARFNRNRLRSRGFLGLLFFLCPRVVAFSHRRRLDSSVRAYQR
jgi:hypothetical protein